MKGSQRHMATKNPPVEETSPAEAPSEAPAKTRQMSGMVPADLYAALDDHRWSVKKSITQLTAAALEEYAKNHGVHWSGNPAPEA
jgi:hypothetical protein